MKREHELGQTAEARKRTDRDLRCIGWGLVLLGVLMPALVTVENTGIYRTLMNGIYQGQEIYVLLAALKPVMRTNWGRLFVFAVTLYTPASWAENTLRVYRDNIYPSLVLLALAALGLRCLFVLPCTLCLADAGFAQACRAMPRLRPRRPELNWRMLLFCVFVLLTGTVVECAIVPKFFALILARIA